jgi:hypothetical protein
MRLLVFYPNRLGSRPGRLAYAVKRNDVRAMRIRSKQLLVVITAGKEKTLVLSKVFKDESDRIFVSVTGDLQD